MRVRTVLYFIYTYFIIFFVSLNLVRTQSKRPSKRQKYILNVPTQYYIIPICIQH